MQKYTYMTSKMTNKIITQTEKMMSGLGGSKSPNLNSFESQYESKSKIKKI